MEVKYQDSRLTVRGLDVLNKTIDISGQNARQKTADLLLDQIKKAGGEARSSAISEIVGGIIGAAAKSVHGGISIVRGVKTT